MTFLPFVESEAAMGWWRDHVVPRMADRFLDTAEVHLLRARTCADLSGDVVEIGFGSGLNVRHYPTAVRSVAAVEPSDLAWRLARPRVASTSTRIVRAGLDGQRLGLADDSVDAALSTFTMCTIPDLDAALGELARVLRPGGRLHFLEHGRSDQPQVARWQDRLQPVNGRLAGGCHIDRLLADHLGRSDLVVEEITTSYGEGPKPFAFRYAGFAIKPLA